MESWFQFHNSFIVILDSFVIQIARAGNKCIAWLSYISFVFAFAVQWIIKSLNFICYQILQQNTIHVDVVGTRFGDGRLANTLRIFDRQKKCVLVIELFHLWTRVPNFAIVSFLLIYHNENALLPERGVQRQNAHQYEIWCYARNENGPEGMQFYLELLFGRTLKSQWSVILWLREWILIVPAKSEKCHANS